LKRIAIFVFVAFVSSCIDPVVLRLERQSPRLVVDALITDEAAPDTIRLSRSLTFDNTQVLSAFVIPEKGATLTITTSTAETVALTEVRPGQYKTPDNFNGQIGLTYVLHIQTSDGKRFVSQPEYMNPVVPIDTILYRYTTYKSLVENASGNFVETSRTGFVMSVQSSDPPDQKNYYRWKANGVFEFFSVSDNPDIKQCWAFLQRLESIVVINEDEEFDGKTFSEDVAIIHYDRPTLFLGTIKQYSLTEASYRFWADLKKQQTSTGSIFDPASPKPIIGNIMSLDDPDEMVYGYFGASSVFEKSVLVNRLKASNFVSPSPYIEPLQGDCRNHVPNATNKKPPGFP
jgi:hypothetical protein